MRQLQRSVAETIPAAQAALVGYYLPDEFVSLLQDWAAEDPDGGQVENGKRRKRNIALGASQLSESERRQREKKMLEEIEDEMKRKKSGRHCEGRRR